MASDRTDARAVGAGNVRVAVVQAAPVLFRLEVNEQPMKSVCFRQAQTLDPGVS